MYKTKEPRAAENRVARRGPRSAEDLMDTLRLLIRKAAIQGVPKEDLLIALKTTLSNYTYLKNAPAAVAVLLFIRRTCHRDCGFVVDDGELRSLWA